MSGLGLNPGDTCYDSTRPDWLPYWFNDIQESECESGTTNWWDAGWSDIGQQTGSAVTGAASSVASGAASGAAAGIANNLSLGGGTLTLAGIAIAVLAVVLLVKK